MSEREIVQDISIDAEIIYEVCHNKLDGLKQAILDIQTKD